MKSAGELKILEVGQFALLKQNLPGQTTLVYTNENLSRAEDIDHKVFDIAMLGSLRRSLAAGAWDIVFCHSPVKPLWDRRYGVPAAIRGLLRRLARRQSLGTYALRGSHRSPLVLLDFNDEPGIPAHNFALLDQSVLCFKRELPTDFAKAFLGQTRALRTHRATMASPFVNRNIGKLRPISAAVPDETADIARRLPDTKDVDVFFAGSINSTIRARGFPVLRALKDAGYVIDICEGGLSQRDYLARCARAWLTWSPEGYGWECLRHYEASLCQSVPILSPPGIFRYQPLEHGVHAVFYAPEADGLRDAIVAALADKARLQIMARTARDHVLSHHTHSKAIAHMIEAAQAALASRQD